MGAVRELRIVRESMSDLGVRRPAAPIAAGGLLSGREREIAELVARGKSSKLIAAALHISDATVKTHLRHIYVKMGVGSRVGLADVVRGIEPAEGRRAVSRQWNDDGPQPAGR
jgi:DNA-binding CsgD family transcriptional regulator